MNRLKGLTFLAVTAVLLASCNSTESAEPKRSDVTVTSTVQEVDDGKTDTELASEQLERMGITISPSTYGQIADIVCEGLADQSSGAAMTDAVAGGIGLDQNNAAKVVAAASVFTCSDQARWLVR